MVGHDALSDGLKHHGLPGLGRRHDQCSLAFSERTEEIDDAVGVVRAPASGEAALEHKLFVGVLGAQPVKLSSMAELVRRATVDREDLPKRRALAVAGRLTRDPDDLVPASEVPPADDLLADVDVVVAGQVTGPRVSYEAGTVAQNLEDA